MKSLALRIWLTISSSFWFVPSLMVLGAIALAAALIRLEVTYDWPFDERWPLLFGAGVSGSRGLLTAVASSMITVAGVVFSITIVSLALSATQYSSRVLRSFMRDRFNQTVLGVFVGVFAYCLVVLRTIHENHDEQFVPSLAVLAGLVLALIGIGYLVFFIHHVAVSIQAAHIAAEIANETAAGVDHLYPAARGGAMQENSDVLLGAPFGDLGCVVPASRTGYIQNIDMDSLLAVAREHGLKLRVERGVGEFIVEGSRFLTTSGGAEFDKSILSRLQAACIIGRQRTLEWDIGFGIRQIVDIALKALSPGINDTTTAVMCVDYLGAILFRLADRPIPIPHRADNGTVRVIGRGPSFQSLLAESFDQIRQCAGGNTAVLKRQLEALETIASRAVGATRPLAIRHHAELVLADAKRSIAIPDDFAPIESAFARISEHIDRRIRP